MTIAFGCGAKKVDSNENLDQSSLISVSGMQVVSNSSSLVGHWSGYFQSDLTTMNITADGTIEIFARGQSTYEKLVTNNNVDFYITDTKNNQLLQLDLNDANFVLYDPDGVDYTFSKDIN